MFCILWFFFVLHKTICVALKKNAKELELKIRDMVWHNRFFISFDNMNFYKHIQDQYFHNKGHPLYYIIDYICLINIDIDISSLDGSAKIVPSN